MSIFNSTPSCDEQIAKAVSETNHSWELKEQRLVASHEIALKEKEFELKHFESEKVKELSAKIVTLEKDLAVEKKTNEMLVKITDLNADVVDVKDLVTKLVDKLPEIKISSLSTTCGGTTKQQG